MTAPAAPPGFASPHADPPGSSGSGAGAGAVAGPRRRGPVAYVLILGIRGYQVARAGHLSLCRYTPSCSQYAVEAITRHGARRGLMLAIRRLGRCRPGGSFGFDPVPE